MYKQVCLPAMIRYIKISAFVSRTLKSGELSDMDVPIDSKVRKRVACAAVTTIIVIALLLAFTIVSTRKATDDVIASVSSVYLHEISDQVVSHFNTGLSNRFAQMDAVASGLSMYAPSDRAMAQTFLSTQEGIGDAAFLAVLTSTGDCFTANGTSPDLDDANEDQIVSTYLNDEAGHEVVIMGDTVVLYNRIEPIACGGEVFTGLVVGYSTIDLGEKFDLDLLGGFSHASMIARNGTAIAVGRGSELTPGENLFDQLDGRVTFPEGSSLDTLRRSLSKGETCIMPLSGNGGGEYLYFMPIGRTEWYLCTSMPYGVIDSDIGNLTAIVARNALIMGGVILIVGLAFFFIYYCLMSKSTRLLAEEKNRAESAFAEAQKANLAKTEFLSRMSHEIRTPMNGIMGMTSIALENMGDDEKVRACLGKVTLSSEHLLSLINDILDMSKIESGKMEIKREVFELETFIGSLTAVLRAQGSERGIAYDTAIDGRIPHSLIGDPLRLNQIIYNLTGNAFKFTPAGGSVTLRVKRIPGVDGRIWLRFSVVDTGYGIEPEYIDKIFLSFEQGDASVARKHGGTGLGLTITKRFVELMGGRIRVASIVGHGSTFTVDVPFEPVDGDFFDMVSIATDIDQVSIPDPVDVNSFDFSGVRILIAEDNMLNQEIAIELMTMAGAVTDTASTGREAVDMFAASDLGFYDLVLMDIQMPEMDGCEASSTIRDLDRADAHSVIILAMTANAFTEDEKRSIASGMDGHISKPLDIRHVYATINEFLEMRRNAR